MKLCRTLEVARCLCLTPFVRDGKLHFRKRLTNRFCWLISFSFIDSFRLGGRERGGGALISFYYTYRFGAFRGERPPFFGGEKYLLKLILPMRETLSHTVLLYVFFIFSYSCDTQEAKAFCYTDTHFI